MVTRNHNVAASALQARPFLLLGFVFIFGIFSAAPLNVAFRFDEPSCSRSQQTPKRTTETQPKCCVCDRRHRFWVHPRCKVRWKGMRCNKIWIIKINVNDSFIRSLLRWLPVAVCVCVCVSVVAIVVCAAYTTKCAYTYSSFGLCFDSLCEVLCVRVWVRGREQKKGSRMLDERLLATLNAVKYSTLSVFPCNSSQLRWKCEKFQSLSIPPRCFFTEISKWLRFSCI